MEKMMQTDGRTKEELKQEAIAIVRDMISEIRDLPELGKQKDQFVTASLENWAGESKVKKILSNQVAKRITKNGASDRHFGKTDPADLDVWKNIGRLIEVYARYAAMRDRENPEWAAALLKQPVKAILSNTDFGDVFEMFDASEQRKLATLKMIQDMSDEFPTKVGVMPLIKLKKANFSIKKMNQSLEAMKDISPDMMPPMLFSFLEKLIDGEEIGTLMNQIFEIIRKLHTGSILTGDAGKSLLEITLTDKLEEIISSLDPVLLRKTVVGLVENYEAAGSSLISTLSDNPHVFMELVSAYASIKNTGIRTQNRKAQMIEELPEEEFADATAKVLADLETQEMAETVNTWLQIINRIHEYHPDITFHPVSSAFSVLDTQALKEAFKWLIPDLVKAVKPVSGAVMPELLKGFCALVTPEPGEDTTELNEALTSVKNILLNTEK